MWNTAKIISKSTDSANNTVFTVEFGNDQTTDKVKKDLIAGDEKSLTLRIKGELQTLNSQSKIKDAVATGDVDLSDATPTDEETYFANLRKLTEASRLVSLKVIAEDAKEYTDLLNLVQGQYKSEYYE